MRRLMFAFALMAALAGCKTADRSLVQDTARSGLEKTVFASDTAVQTMTFSSGETTTFKPYAIDSFLYAKRWLSCKSTQRGAFSEVSTCSFNSDGRTFATQNGWSAQPGSCGTCQIWTVPIARARLLSVDSIAASDTTHASATYTYIVDPNVFGRQLGDWMAKNVVAWCGPDPRAVGEWAKNRTATTAFARGSTGWAPVSPAAAFTTAFGAGIDASTDRPCPTAPAS